MRIYARFFLTCLGGFSLATLFHELYHWFFQEQPVQMCYVADEKAIMFVQGYGASSEVIAYTITSLILLATVAFAIYDLSNSEDLK